MTKGPLIANSRGHFKIGARNPRGNRGARGNKQVRGRGKQPFVRQTSENDPYDMSIAPMNIYEKFR